MIALDVQGGIATATLCRAPVNAINEEWLAALNGMLDEVERNADVKVLWIRSSERVFCAGADLALMRERFASDAGRREMVAMAGRMQNVYARVEKLAKVSIAELGGAALGGGFELALACDLRTIADTAKVGLPEARLGLLPGAGGTQRMTLRCGDSVARRLILGAELVSGKDAVGLGLAHWVVPAAELEAYTRDIARRVAAMPAAALAACKRCIDAALDPGSDGFEVELAETAMLYASGETQGLVKQFLEKQK
jgi:enoyl-CoA hydratase/carnithine racemase